MGDEDTDSDISSNNRLLSAQSGIYDEEVLMQEQLFEGEEWNYNFYSGYNEPINDQNYFTFGFNRSHNHEDNLRNAFDLDPDDISNRIPNQALSNHFRRDMEKTAFVWATVGTQNTCESGHLSMAKIRS